MKQFLLVLSTLAIFQIQLVAQSDDCASAPNIPTSELDCINTSDGLTGTTIGALPDGIDFGCINSVTDTGVWYQFTATGADIEIQDNSGHLNAPYIAIIDNDCVAGSILICQQLPILDVNGEGDDLLTPGSTYLMWIGFQGETNTYDLCVSNLAPPPNDDCLSALPFTPVNCVTGPGGTLIGTTENAAPDGFDATCISAATNSWEGVWYSFIADGYDLIVSDVGGNSPYIVITDNCDLGVALEIYCGQTPVDLTNAPHADNLLNIGQQYFVWVGFNGGNEESFELCIENPKPPANDECAAAEDISNRIHCVIDGQDAIEGTIYGAFPDGLDFSCLPAGSNGWEGVWYTFTTEGHDLIIETQGNVDPYIAIIDVCGPGLEYYCGQVPVDLSTANNIFNLTQVPTTVLMWVGFDQGLDSTFTICVENPPPPPNDLCTMPEVVPGTLLMCDGTVGTGVLGTTNYSTLFGDFAGLPPPCINSGGPPDEVVWYSFIATGVDLELTDLMGNDPSFAIFREGTDCAAPTIDDLVACGFMPYSFDNGDPDDILNVGETYLMMVGFLGGWSATDSFELCFNNPAPPDNDLCSQAEKINQDQLDCPETPNSVYGYTTNASQDNTYWTNLDPALLPCALDTFEDDGVWYQFTAIGTDIEIQDNLGNNPTIILMNFNNCGDTAEIVFCQQTPITSDFGDVGNLATVVGDNYLMYVTFQGGESEADTFDLCIDNEGTCSAPQPANSWCTADPICGLLALDAFCMDMAVQGIPSEAWPGCANSLDNPNWFSFVAGAANLTIQVQVGDCTGQGIQIGMYEIDCTQDLGPSQPFCSPTELGPLLTGCGTVSTPQPPGSVVTFNAVTEFGHVYAIVIDGWGPALCQIEIDVLVGGNPPDFDDVMLDPPQWDDTLFPFESDTVCAGAEEVEFSLAAEVPGACRYNWTLNGMGIPDAENSLTEFIDFPVPGTFEVCVSAANFCDSTAPECITVVVAALDPHITYDTICEGDPYVWIGPFGDPIPFNPPFSSDDGGDYDFNGLAVNAAGCEIDAELHLHIREENDDTPTLIDTVICYDQLDFEFPPGQPVGVPVVEGVALGHPFDRLMAHDGQCDSFFTLDLFALEAIISYATVFQPFSANVNCFDSVIMVCPDNIGVNPLFYPDPLQYPDVEIHYQWYRTFDNQPVGTDNICLVIDFDDFLQNEQRFEVEVTMTKGGRPAGGCMFGPFDFELKKSDFIPDSLQILGPDTVCIGPEYDYDLQRFLVEAENIFPNPEGYLWDISQFPGANRMENTELNSTFTFSELTTGLICAQVLHSCSPGPITCKTVVVSAPQAADPGPNVEECTNDYVLNASNANGAWFTSDRPIGAADPVFSDINSPTSAVSITQKGVYEFGWIVSAYGCADTAYVEIDFIDPMSLDGDIIYACDAVNETYTAVFSFLGGIAPYVVTSGNGTLNGMEFTSDPILQGDTVVVLITDAQNCTGSFVLIHECPCLTEPAVMNQDAIESCGEACVTITPFTPPVLDANDIAVYVLHTSNTDQLGTVIEENTTGEFCYSPSGPIQFGVQYYVSIVAGDDVGGTPDLADACTVIAPGQPVIWYEIPSPTIGANDATCSDSYQLSVSNSNFSGTWMIESSGTNVDFSDQDSPTSSLTALGCGVVNLMWIETNQICIDTSRVTIEFYCNPTNTPPVPSCNVTQTELTFTFELTGVGPFIELNGRGTIVGNTVELSGIPLPMMALDTLFIEDVNGCQLVVPISIADCNCLPNVFPDTICGLTIELNALGGTGNSGYWALGSVPAGQTANIVDVNSRVTNVTVSDYGEYCFDWTEVGALCEGMGQSCVIFANSPEIDLSTVQFNCNANYDGYTVSFEIVNGHLPSYSVFDENGFSIGQVIGNTFTSTEIPSTQPISIRVADGFMCDTFVQDTVHDCGCFTAVGDMDVTPIDLCDGDQTSVVYNELPNEMRDGNDSRIFILYTDPADPIGSIVSENPLGDFNFIDPPMVLGTTYYISAVLGNADPSGVDYLDPCLVISLGVPVTWYDATVPAISQSDAEFTCLIDQMTLTVSSPDDITDYNIVWSTIDGGIESGDETVINPRINGPGTYTVTLTHAIAGCPSTASIKVDISDDVPEVNILQPIKLTCDLTEIVVSGLGSDASPSIRYVWTGPGIVGSDTTLDIMANQIGLYTLRLIDDANGCEVTASITVEEDVDDPAIAVASNDILDCTTLQVDVSGAGSASGANITYSWSVVSATGNIVSSPTGQDIVADQPGTYQLIVTNTTNGCESIKTVQVNQDNRVISGFDLAVLQPGCDGLDDGQVSIVNIDGGTGPFMYSFNGGIDFTSSLSQSNMASGVYDVVVIDDNGCEFTKTVVLTQPVDFTVDLGSTLFIDFGDTAFIQGQTTLPDSLLQSVSWTPLVDPVNQNTLMQQFVPELGQHSFIVTVTNTNGCVGVATVLVVVKFGERIYIPTAMNPNSINSANQRINIFADPASVAAIHSFSIYNRWGERVFERASIVPSLTYDPSNSWDGIWQDELAPTGVYVYYTEVEFITGVRKVISGEFTLTR